MKTTIITLCLFTTCLSQAQTVTDFLTIENPGSVEVDARGNFWVSYRTDGSYHLAKVTPWGLLIPVVEESFELGSFGVNNDFIWISSTSNGKVYKYTHQGVKIDSVNVATPEEIVLNADGSWHLSQSQSSRILSYTAANSQNIAATGLPLNGNIGLAFDEEGFMYTCNRHDGNVIRINPATGTKSVIASLPRDYPYSVGYLTYRDGYVYVTSAMNCIYKADTTGTELYVFAGIEGLAGDLCGDVATALLDEPIGLAFSVTGDTLFVSDAGSNKIKAISGLNSLGGRELAKKTIAMVLYPNPANEWLSIRVDDQQVRSVEITDPNARLVQSESVNHAGEISLDVSALSKGTYFVTVTTEKGKVARSVFVKT